MNTRQDTLVTHELHADQQYIFEVGRLLGYDLKLVGHPIETRTCAEKARLLSDTQGLDWPVERVVKALYSQLSHIDDERAYFVGVVTPEVGKKVDLAALAEHVFQPMPSGGQFHADPRIPKGMAYGTCTPFPRERQLDGDNERRHIRSIIIFDHPSLDDKLVDISVGGGDSHSRKTSMHLPYGAIYGILSHRFPEAVMKVEPRYLS